MQSEMQSCTHQGTDCHFRAERTQVRGSCVLQMRTDAGKRMSMVVEFACVVHKT